MHRFMLSASHKLQVIILLLLVAAITQSGCKENTIINAKVAPADNSVNVFDTTLSVVTHTYYDDSISTSTNIGGISIYQGVGAITDPFFGTMTGATYFQLIPEVFANTFDSLHTIDSAILFLPYSGFSYGDTANTSLTQSYQVFYMQDTMALTSNYYPWTTKAIDVANPLSVATTANLYSLTDTYSVNGIYYFKGLRIKLKLPVLLGHLLPALNILTTSTNPTGDFVNAFPGICVRPTNTSTFTTAIPYFQLDGADQYSEAGITVYSHTTNAAVPDTVTSLYYFNSGVCAHYNSIVKSYTHSPVNNLLHSAQPNDSIIALQNQPGASIDVVIPGIKKIPIGIINKAELQLTLLPNYNSTTLFSPYKLYPLGIGNGNYPAGVGAGLAYDIADRYPLTSLSPLGVMDGYMHQLPLSAPKYSTYTIDIPREVMASIFAKNDTIHLHINGTEDYYGAFHMVAGGGNYPDSNYRAKIKIVYSKLNK